MILSILNRINKMLNLTNENNKHDDFFTVDNYQLYEVIQKNEDVDEVKKIKFNEKKIDLNDNIIEIKSKIVGVFYYNSDKKKSDAVKSGDKVKKGQILGYIKCLNNYNEIICECDGIIKEVNIEDSNIAEYNKLLFTIISI